MIETSRIVLPSQKYEEADEVYADGGIIGAKNPSSYGGTWAFRYTKGESVIHEDSGFFTPCEFNCLEIENNQSEFIALLYALESLPVGWYGKIFCDNLNTLGRFFKGWSLKGITPNHQVRMKRCVARIDMERSEYVLLDGHPSRVHLARGLGKRNRPVSIHNKECDRMCCVQSIDYLETLKKKFNNGK